MRGAPVPPGEYDGEYLDTDEKLQAEGWAAGLDVWEQVGKAYEWYGPGGDDVDSGALQNAQLWSLREAIRAEYLAELAAAGRLTVAEGRKAAADAVWARAKSLRAKDFPAGKVGIEYVNGFEDAAHVADPDCKP